MDPIGPSQAVWSFGASNLIRSFASKAIQHLFDVRSCVSNEQLLWLYFQNTVISPSHIPDVTAVQSTNLYTIMMTFSYG